MIIFPNRFCKSYVRILCYNFSKGYDENPPPAHSFDHAQDKP